MTDQELNEAVARKLGWILPTREFEPWKLEGHPGVMRTQAEMPAYSTSIEAAWEIVQSLPTTDRFRLIGENGIWSCAIKRDGFDWGVTPIETAPRAICEAFLKLNTVETK